MPAKTTTRLLDKLLKAAVTGHHGVISVNAVHKLMQQGQWWEALRRIAVLDAIHINAQYDFGLTWKQLQFGSCREQSKLDDATYYAALRKIFGPYPGCSAGGDLTLYRGHDDPEARIGTSWTTDKLVALRFALLGLEDPKETEPRSGGVVLTATVPANAIICSMEDILGRDREGEHLIDPRGLVYTSEPARREDWEG